MVKVRREWEHLGAVLVKPSLLPLHRYAGYLGVVCVVFGMLFALLNEYTYASPSSLIGNLYTSVLAVGASLNAVQGVRAVRGGKKKSGPAGVWRVLLLLLPGGFECGRSLPSHKDHMLMSLMWTADPAVHRFAMWVIRFVGSGFSFPLSDDPAVIDPTLLLLLGKMPANLFLFVTFGHLLTKTKRFNWTTGPQISFHFMAYCVLAIMAFSAIGTKVGWRVWVPTLLGLVALLVAAAIFVARVRRDRQQLY